MKIRHYALGLLAALAAVPGLAADIDGKWTATVDGMQGPINLVFEFKAEGDKLSGTMGSADGQMPATPISEGVLAGDDVSFKLSLALMPDAPPLVISYKGKVSGDALNLVSTLDFGQGPMETPLVASRAK